MNTLLVYFSKFGNTQLVAERIAAELQKEGPVRLLSAGELVADHFDGTDLVVMGTPTHKMNLPEAVKPVLASLPRGILKGVPFAAFDTSYKMSWWLNLFTASKRLSRKLRRLGGRQLVRPEIFLVQGKEGPLYEGELARAAAWAHEIVESYLHVAGAPAEARRRASPGATR